MCIRDSFVVAHLQLGLLLRKFGVPLREDRERVGIYLTNALTNWEPLAQPGQQIAIPFPEFQEERDKADEIKQRKTILVILGNPPYNAFAGISPEQEGDLVEAYKENLNKPVADGGWGIKKFNLDDLYAVSYTHLDVYKRQRGNSASASSKLSPRNSRRKWLSCPECWPSRSIRPRSARASAIRRCSS